MVAVVVFVLCWLKIQDTFFRRRGKWVERRAIAALRLPKGWEMHPNVPVPGLGDCDVLIKGADKQLWAVEIKSYEGARKAPFSFFRRKDIVRESGKAFERDPIQQIRRVADALQSRPVLWMPKARKNETFITRLGVIVVQGNHRGLEHAIGARSWWSL